MAMRKGEVTLGSGNVFKDLGLKNPEELLAKAKLAATADASTTSLSNASCAS